MIQSPRETLLPIDCYEYPDFSAAAVDALGALAVPHFAREANDSSGRREPPPSKVAKAQLDAEDAALHAAQLKERLAAEKLRKENEERASGS